MTHLIYKFAPIHATPIGQKTTEKRNSHQPTKLISAIIGRQCGFMLACVHNIFNSNFKHLNK